MSDVWLGRINRGVEKLFNVKGGPTVLDVDPSIRVSWPITSGVEDRILQSWNRFWLNVLGPATAAINAGVQLRNPAGSNVVAVIEKLSIRVGTGTSQVNLSAAQINADFTNQFSGFRQDARGNPNSVCILSTQTTAIGNLANVVGVFFVGQVPNVEIIQTINQEILMLPGDAMRLQDATVNETLQTTWLWRERPLEPSELT